DPARDRDADLAAAAALVHQAGGVAERAGPEAMVAAFPTLREGIGVALAVAVRWPETLRVGLHAVATVLSADGARLREAPAAATRLAAAGRPGTIVVSASGRSGLPRNAIVHDIAVDGGAACVVAVPPRGAAVPRRTVLLVGGLFAVGGVLAVLSVRRRRE